MLIAKDFTRAIALLVFLCSFLFMGCGSTKVNLVDEFKEGKWRTEFTGAAGLSTGELSDRGDDTYFSGSIEYQWPIHEHATLGIRSYPLLAYLQDRNDKKQSDTVYAYGGGLALRLYQKKNEQKGFFGEIGSSLMRNDPLYRDNASHLNFLSEVGIGYKFDSGKHIALKYQHISNAGMERPNAGINGIALSVGFTF
jgi:hypothetical protein